MARKLTPAQQRVVDAVRAGSLRVAMTGTHEGNIVHRLVRAGVLRAANRTLERAERTYWGRYIPPTWHYSGLSVVGE